MQRNLTITIPALLAVSVLMASLALIGRVDPLDRVLSPKLDANSSIAALNKRNSSAKSVLCPSIKAGIASNSSLFYRKNDKIAVSNWFLGLREAVVVCDESEYCFWIRSFDAKSIYFCERDKLERTTLRPIMRPEVMIMAAWIGEIGSPQEIQPSPAGFVARTRRGSMDVLVEFDHEKILAQSATIGGVSIVTLEGGDFADFSGLIMPKRIRVTWHEEKISGEFFVDKWIINAEDPMFSPPKGLKRINLEDYSSSSRKSVFASSSPVPGDR